MLLRRLSRWVILLCLLTSSLSLTAGLDIYLEIPGIRGEADDGVYRDWIEIVAYSWNMESPPPDHSGGGTGVPRPSACAFRFTKFTDAATTLLFRAVALGVVYPEATLKIIQTASASGEPARVVKEYRFTDIYITQHEVGASDGEQRTTETLAFYPTRVETIYYEYAATGALTQTHSAYYDYSRGTGG